MNIKINKKTILVTLLLAVLAGQGYCLYQVNAKVDAIGNFIVSLINAAGDGGSNI